MGFCLQTHLDKISRNPLNLCHYNEKKNIQIIPSGWKVSLIRNRESETQQNAWPIGSSMAERQCIGCLDAWPSNCKQNPSLWSPILPISCDFVRWCPQRDPDSFIFWRKWLNHILILLRTQQKDEKSFYISLRISMTQQFCFKAF